MRILLVEDDLNLAQFIRKGLKEEQLRGPDRLICRLGCAYDAMGERVFD